MSTLEQYYQNKQNNTMKITKKDCKNKQEMNIQNYLTKKKYKEKILKKQISKDVQKINKN